MTHTYPEIKPADIKAADTIRWESDAAHIALAAEPISAIEYEASRDAFAWRDWGTHYLVNRPTLPVELLKDWTLGLIEQSGTRELGVFKSHEVRSEDSLAVKGVAIGWGEDVWFRVTAFTPATAVKTESLDALRKVAAACDATYPDYQKAISVFLADVDKANS